MDPISMIVGALVAGSSDALKDTANKAVKDSYQGLKNLVIHYWKTKTEGDEKSNESEAEVLLSNLEEDPGTYQTPLEKKIAKIIPEPDQDLIEKAQQIYKLLDEEGFNAGKYNVSVSNSQGVQIGDHNTQVNKF